MIEVSDQLGFSWGGILGRKPGVMISLKLLAKIMLETGLSWNV